MVKMDTQEHKVIYDAVKDVHYDVKNIKDSVKEQEGNLRENIATWGRSLIGVMTGRGG